MQLFEPSQCIYLYTFNTDVEKKLFQKAGAEFNRDVTNVLENDLQNDKSYS